MAVENVIRSASPTCSAACPTCTSTWMVRSRSRAADGLRSLPETRWPIAARTPAMALMPAPPMPTTWMRKPGVRRSTFWGTGFSVTGHAFDDGRHFAGGVGMPVCQRRLAHRGETGVVVQEDGQLARQARPVEIAIRNQDRRALVDQRLGVGRLVVTGCTRKRHENGRDAGDRQLGDS